MTDSKKKVAEALALAKTRKEIDDEIQAYAEKQQAVFRAEEVILAAISKWTGIPISNGDPIPVVRDGRKVGEIPKPYFGRNRAGQVAEASLIEHRSELEKKISQLQSVIESTKQLVEALNSMGPIDLPGLNHGNWPLWNALRDERPPLKTRLIKEIGLVESALIASRGLAQNAESKRDELKAKLEKHKTGRGRPRNEAAHAVARELALLYAEVTGNMPTYAEGPNGLSGEFTPVLRDVFDALGWKRTSLRRPAQTAIENVSGIDRLPFDYDETPPLGGLLGYSPE